MDDPIMDAAIAYAERGWSVIPLHGVNDDGTCTCHLGMECDSPGKHPLHRDWPEKASADPDQVRAWWEAFRGAPRNVGIVCGKSNLVVIDIDDADGERRLQQIAAQIPPCPQVRTRRGIHLYLSGQVQAAKLTGLDIKAGNGFVVAPPSIRVDGGRYEWA
jgi:putative DNA primase/helicase